MGQPNLGLSQQVKDKINNELKFLQEFFIRIDVSIDNGMDKEKFLLSYGILYDYYIDLLNNGTDRERAKAILMKGFKDQVEEMELNAKNSVLDG